MSVGPLLTGYIMHATGLLLPVFYATATIDTIVTLGVWLIMPESLSKEEMQKRRAIRAETFQAMPPWKRWWSTFDIVSPLAVLLPRRVDRPGNKRAIDWTMTILGVAYGFGTMVQVCLSARLLRNGADKFVDMMQAALYQQIQYASSVFHWTSGVVSAPNLNFATLSQRKYRSAIG